MADGVIRFGGSGRTNSDDGGATAATAEARARAARGDLLAIEQLSASSRTGEREAIDALTRLTLNDTPFHCAVALSHPAYGLTGIGEVAEEVLLTLVADPQVPAHVKASVRGHAFNLYMRQVANAGTGGAGRAPAMSTALLYLAGRHADHCGPKAEYDRINALFEARLADVCPGFEPAGVDVLCPTRCVTEREVMLTGGALRHTALHPVALKCASDDLKSLIRDGQLQPILDTLLEPSCAPATLLLAAVQQDGRWGAAAFRKDADGAIEPFMFGTVDAWKASLGGEFAEDIPNASGPISAIFMRDLDFQVGEHVGPAPFRVLGFFAGWIVRWYSLPVAQREALLDVERARMLARVVR